MQALQTLQGEGIDQVLRAPYRVHFWERPTDDHAWNLDAWVLLDCEDVYAALDWASTNANHRRYQIFALCDCGPCDDRLVLLCGSDPNSAIIEADIN